MMRFTKYVLFASWLLFLPFIALGTPAQELRVKLKEDTARLRSQVNNVQEILQDRINALQDSLRAIRGTDGFSDTNDEVGLGAQTLFSASNKNERLIIKFKNPTAKAQALKRFNLHQREEIFDPVTVTVDVPVLTSKEVLQQALAASADVEYAEPDFEMHAFMIPNDPYYNPYQWNFDHINAPAAWDKSKGKGVVVAVVDTGVAYEKYRFKYIQCSDFAGTSFVQGYDYVSKDSHPNDENGHGTHIAGIIAETTNNFSGAAGLAFEASIMPVRVLDAFGSGYTSWVANGIKYAADNGAKIINLSLGGSASKTLEDAVKYAQGKGAIVVAASGNESASSVSYPASYPGVIAVGAVGFDNVRAAYSNQGSALALVAPGGDMSEDLNGDGYGDGILQQTLVQNWNGTGNTRKCGYYFYQGTSMATPHVAAAAAMIIANGITASQVQQKLTSTATDLGPLGWDPEYGWGLLNIAAALGV